jgi:hypothetical protein
MTKSQSIGGLKMPRSNGSTAYFTTVCNYIFQITETNMEKYLTGVKKSYSNGSTAYFTTVCSLGHLKFGLCPEVVHSKPLTPS